MSSYAMPPSVTAALQAGLAARKQQSSESDGDIPPSEIQDYSAPEQPVNFPFNGRSVSGPPQQMQPGPMADQPAYSGPPVNRQAIAALAQPSTSAVARPMGENLSDGTDAPANAPQQAGPPPPNMAVPTLNDPNLPHTSLNTLNNGTPKPNLQDDKYQQMGRGASMKSIFLNSVMNHGLAGLVPGAIGAVVGALDPSMGRQNAYNIDNQRWLNSKMAEEKVKQEDPYYQSQLKVATQGSEIPSQVEKYNLEQKINYGLRGDYLKQQGQQRLNEIAARGLNQKTAIETRQSLKNTGDLDGLTALYTGMIDPDTGQKFTADEAAQQAKADILDQKTAKTEKLWSQQNLADSRAAQVDAITKNLPQKFKDLHDRLTGFLQNVQTNKERLELQKGNAADRAENQRQLRQGTALQSEVNILENDHKAQNAIVNNPYNQTPDKKPLVDAANKRIQEINSRLDEITQQRLETAGAPGKGQKATKPGGPTLSTGHKAGDTVKVGGKDVRITKVHPDGKTFDYEAIP